jgi:hypothetical protein
LRTADFFIVIFSQLDAASKQNPDELSSNIQSVTQMTRLRIAEDPGEEFVLRAHNVLTNADEDAIIFYNDVTKVQVVPESSSFTIQILTPSLVVEMDFADADAVRNALALFEAKKVLAVDFQVSNTVRLMPTDFETVGT